MSRQTLCAALYLPSDASTPAIRARAARLATGRPEFGSSPAKRRELAEALRLAPCCSDLAIVRVVESVLRPHPLSRRARVTSILAPTQRRTTA